MKRFLGGILVLMLAATGLAQTVRVGLNEDPDILDPDLGRTYVGRIVFASLCDKLFDITQDAEIVPQLATGYEFADDNLSLTIDIRDGVMFHDGTTLDAEAVKYNLERSKNFPGSNRASELEQLRERRSRRREHRSPQPLATFRADCRAARRPRRDDGLTQSRRS